MATARACTARGRCAAGGSGSCVAPGLQDTVQDHVDDLLGDEWLAVGDVRVARRRRSAAQQLGDALDGEREADGGRRRSASRARCRAAGGAPARPGTSRAAWACPSPPSARRCRGTAAAAARVGRPAARAAAGRGRSRRSARGTLRVELPLEHGVEQLVLGREAAEDRALGDAGGLGDQLGRRGPAVLVEQRPGRRDDRLAPVLRRQRPGALAAAFVEARVARHVAHGAWDGQPDTEGRSTHSQVGATPAPLSTNVRTLRLSRATRSSTVSVSCAAVIAGGSRPRA